MNPRRVLLCSAWQAVNIGDVAHTPGALALIERSLPGADVTLWAFRPLTPDARAMILRRFPRVEILETPLDVDDACTDPAVLAAMDRADFFLHGSGPSMLGWAHAEAFSRRTGRGFGVYGVTYGLYGIPEKETLSRARFVYFRDSVSLARASEEGVNPPIMGWSPDTAFAFDLHDDARADAFLAANGLEDGKFLCCISRYRNTPHWVLHPDMPFDADKAATNEQMKIADHAPLLEAIVGVVRETDFKILLCPEDASQMAVTRVILYERLPADVRTRVVWRETYWQPDEAVSVYRRSAGLFGHEMHSPIMCIAQGVPAIVCRWAEQSTKGIMWRDIGLGEWLFDLDQPGDVSRVASAVLALAKDPEAARAKAARARDMVRKRFEETMAVVASAAGDAHA